MENNKIKIIGHDYTELDKNNIMVFDENDVRVDGVADETIINIAKDFLENYSKRI